jgi:HK97 family phage prohead protease
VSKPTERRSVRGLVEVRAADGVMRIGGYAAKFNTRSQNLGGFVETVLPMFFNKSAGDGFPGVMARYNHDDNWLLGTTAGQTLRLGVDGTGLDYEVDLPSFRSDVFELVQRGDVQKSSFAFITFEDDWSLDENGFPLRSLVSGQLIDVAPVNTPAYTDTSSGLRSLAERREMPVEDVARIAAEGRLSDLLSAAPVVIDLGEQREDPKPEPVEQAPATPPARIQLLRRELDLKQKAQ